MSDSSEIDRVMVDIETLGLKPGAVIAAIGAAVFTPKIPPKSDPNGAIKETYEASISITSCEEVGLQLDADTVEFWLTQGDDAQEMICGGGDLEPTLEEFDCWLNDVTNGGVDEIWANDPAFDCVLLSRAYDAVGRDPPWDYSNRRCYRTLKELGEKPDLDQQGTKHNPVDDAIYQARVAAEILTQLNP